jgi:hypothetical protein
MVRRLVSVKLDEAVEASLNTKTPEKPGTPLCG